MLELNELHKKWLKSLREHPERQGKKKLGHIINTDTKEYTACCLGELLCIYKKGNVFNNKGDIVDGSSEVILNDSYKELGLYSPVGRSRDLASPTLSQLNDNGKSWPEIADIIESNPEMYLNYKTQ